eukprot:489785-Pelagomonas_calceolata.AAC.1
MSQRGLCKNISGPQEAGKRGRQKATSKAHYEGQAGRSKNVSNSGYVQYYNSIDSPTHTQEDCVENDPSH